MLDTPRMALFAGITGLISVIVGWLVTIRLFALARRTRQEPERLLAIAFGGLFCVGYPMAGASRAPGLSMTTEGALFFAIGAIGMVIGIIALGRFPRVVFRPDAAWAKILSLAITLVGIVGGTGCALASAFAHTKEEMVANIQIWAIALVLAIFGSFTWNAIESIRYWRIMKRRMALGLAQAETTHRFFLWGISSATSIITAVSIIVIRGSGLPIMAPLPMAIISCTTFVTSTCWWLAFFMPDAYRVHVLGLSEPKQAPSAE